MHSTMAQLSFQSNTSGCLRARRRHWSAYEHFFTTKRCALHAIGGTVPLHVRSSTLTPGTPAQLPSASSTVPYHLFVFSPFMWMTV